MIFLRAPLSDDIIIKISFPCPRPIDLPEQDVETAASGIEASNKHAICSRDLPGVCKWLTLYVSHPKPKSYLPIGASHHHTLILLEGGDVPRAIGLPFDPQLRDHALCRAQGVQAKVGLQRHRQLRVEACFLQGHQLTHLCHEGLGFGLLVLVCTWDQVHGAHLHLRWLRLNLGAWVVLHLQRVHEICRKEEDVLVELFSLSGS